MDVEVWSIVSAIAAVLALIGIVVAVMSFRRQFPKREVQYGVEAFPLLSEFAQGYSPGLKVTLGSRELSDPYVIRVTVLSRSRADIPSTSFDGNMPLVFESSKPILVSGMTASSDSSIGIVAEANTDTFEVPAQLIRRGAGGYLGGISEGKPEITPGKNVLIDIPLKDVTARLQNGVSPTPWRDMKWVLSAGAASVLLGIVLTAWAALSKG